jgi:hypothetical protein
MSPSLRSVKLLNVSSAMNILILQSIASKEHTVGIAQAKSTLLVTAQRKSLRSYTNVLYTKIERQTI